MRSYLKVSEETSLKDSQCASDSIPTSASLFSARVVWCFTDVLWVLFFLYVLKLFAWQQENNTSHYFNVRHFFDWLSFPQYPVQHLLKEQLNLVHMKKCVAQCFERMVIQVPKARWCNWIRVSSVIKENLTCDSLTLEAQTTSSIRL